MNASDVLKYGQLTLLSAFEGLPDDAWTTPGACGVWSVRDIAAHLASYERVLVDVIGGLVRDDPTPHLDLFLREGPAFNDAAVARRAGLTPAETLEELGEAHAQTMALIAAVPDTDRHRAGVFPWYGAAYDLEDLLVYMAYGHKREHAAQIALVRDRLAP